MAGGAIGMGGASSGSILKTGIIRREYRKSGPHRSTDPKASLTSLVWAFILVTSLFFLWGFAYGLLDVLNKHFQNILGISRLESTGLQSESARPA